MVESHWTSFAGRRVGPASALVCVPENDLAAASPPGFSWVGMSCAPSLSSPGRGRWALGRNGRGNSMPGWACRAPASSPLPPEWEGSPQQSLAQLSCSGLVFTEQLQCLQ